MISVSEQFTFGEKLRLAMTARDYTQAALAEKLKVTRSTVNKWALNRCIPSPEVMSDICKVLALPKLARAAMTFHCQGDCSPSAEAFARSPSCFGTLLGLTRRQIALVLEGAQLLYFELFDLASQESIRRLCGAYIKYCFSVRHRTRSLVYTSVVHIMENKDGYYFREEHAGDEGLESPPLSTLVS